MEWFFSLSFFNQVLIVYLIFINLVTFFLFGLDKSKSLSKSQRIRERTLWLFSLFGGSFGALSAMKIFRHKTQKTSFQLVFGLILLAQLGLIFFILR